MLITTRGLTQMLVVFFGGRLLELNNRHLYIVCFLCSSLGLLLLGTSRNVPVLMLACAILGIFNGLMTLVTFTQVGSIHGQKGKIAGIFSFGQKTGMVAGPVLGGVVGDLHRPPGHLPVLRPLLPRNGRLLISSQAEGRATRKTAAGSQ